MHYEYVIGEYALKHLNEEIESAPPADLDNPVDATMWSESVKTRSSRKLSKIRQTPIERSYGSMSLLGAEAEIGNLRDFLESQLHNAKMLLADNEAQFIDLYQKPVFYDRLLQGSLPTIHEPTRHTNALVRHAHALVVAAIQPALPYDSETQSLHDATLLDFIDAAEVEESDLDHREHVISEKTVNFVLAEIKDYTQNCNFYGDNYLEIYAHGEHAEHIKQLIEMEQFEEPEALAANYIFETTKLLISNFAHNKSLHSTSSQEKIYVMQNRMFCTEFAREIVSAFLVNPHFTGDFLRTLGDDLYLWVKGQSFGGTWGSLEAARGDIFIDKTSPLIKEEPVPEISTTSTKEYLDLDDLT